jgi:hypothetical protein
MGMRGSHHGIAEVGVADLFCRQEEYRSRYGRETVS